MNIHILTLGALCLAGAGFRLRDFSKKNYAKFFSVFAVLLMGLMLGLRRSDVGEDTASYMRIFDLLRKAEWLDIFSHLRIEYVPRRGIESGFAFLCKFVHSLGGSSQVFLAVMGTLTFWLVMKFINDNSEDKYLSVYVTLTDFSYMIAYNGARQMLAAALALQIYTLLRRKKTIKALIVLWLSMLIHQSALVTGVLFPLMLYEPKNKRKSFIYVTAIVISLPFLVSLLGAVIASLMPQYGAYLVLGFWKSRANGVMILWGIEILMMLQIYSKNFRFDWSYCLCVLVMLMFAFEISGLILSSISRIAWYFRLYLILFFPDFFQYMPGRYRKAAKFALYVLLALEFFSYARQPRRNYHFYWQNTK